MYRSFFELEQKPFQITTDPRFLWLGEKHKEALSILKYGILDNKWFLLLTGDVGTGKTTLINALLKSLDDSVIVATVPDPGLDELDLFNYIADLYDIQRTFATKGEFLIRFKRFLNDVHDDGKKILLIIDEAQQLNQERLEVIRLLSNIERQETKLINIFFVGQNEFNDTLRRPENRALRQRITINYNISPLTADETAEYIAHRLKVAGASRKIFHPDAVKRVAVFTGGYPRLINVLCDYALVTGYVKGARVIMPTIIDECARELQIPGGAPLPRQEPVQATIPPPRIPSGPDAVPPIAESFPTAASTQRAHSHHPGDSSATPSGKPPVKVVMRQARMPSKKPRRKTGLYLAMVVLLALGALFYFLPAGFLPLPGNFDRSSEKVEKPSAAVSPEARLPEEAGKRPTATASPEASVPGTSWRPDAKKEVDALDVTQPTASVPEQEPSAASGYAAESAGSPDSPVTSESTGVTERPDARSPELPKGSPPESNKKRADGSEKLPSGDSPSPKTPESVYERGDTVASLGKKVTAAPMEPLQELSRPQVSADETAADDAELQENLRRLAREKKLLVYFGRDSNEMQKNTFALLDALSVFMRRHPTARVVIRGYTDSSGVYSYNKKLSEFRANMVKSYLVGKGTDSNRIRTLGMGPDNPLKSNQFEKTRRFNRRVEIEIVMNAQ